MHLLPTPNATHGRPASRTGPLLDGIGQLLPTPTAGDGSSGPGHAGSAEGTPNLRTTVVTLLPTPMGANGGADRGSTSGNGLRNAVRPDKGGQPWGRYAAAVARWEAVTDNPAPEPTVPGTKGQPTLNPRLSEWMMGLPPGWLDVPGVSVSAQKAVAGNGVVPAQAVLALRLLLDLP